MIRTFVLASMLTLGGVARADVILSGSFASSTQGFAYTTVGQGVDGVPFPTYGSLTFQGKVRPGLLLEPGSSATDGSQNGFLISQSFYLPQVSVVSAQFNSDSVISMNAPTNFQAFIIPEFDGVLFPSGSPITPTSMTPGAVGEGYFQFGKTLLTPGVHTFGFELTTNAPAGSYTLDLTSFTLTDSLNTNAVPEPGSLTLAALAGLGLAGTAWRRARRAT